jgi:hypothetical protein
VQHICPLEQMAHRRAIVFASSLSSLTLKRCLFDYALVELTVRGCESLCIRLPLFALPTLDTLLPPTGLPHLFCKKIVYHSLSLQLMRAPGVLVPWDVVDSPGSATV